MSRSFGRRNAGFLNPPVAKNNIESGRGAEKALHLPARSRFGEGRAAPLEVGYMRF